MNQVNQSQKHSGGDAVSSPRPAQVDGYWLRIGALAVEALAPILRPDITPRRRELTGEYLGGLMDNAYKMGIRLGESKGWVACRNGEPAPTHNAPERETESDQAGP